MVLAKGSAGRGSDGDRGRLVFGLRFRFGNRLPLWFLGRLRFGTICFLRLFLRAFGLRCLWLSISLLDISNHFSHRDRFPLLFEYLLQHPRARGGNFERCLVGFELDDALILLHFLARLFEPAPDLDFLNGFADGGYFELDGHDVSILLAGAHLLSSPRRISSCCSVSCCRLLPAAGLALEGREMISKG